MSGLSDLQITDEFEHAFDVLENTQNNVFITGKAGTGKSTFLQYFRKHTNKNVVTVAPTGVAALNAHGQTIHSFFGFKPRFIDLESIKASSRRRKVLSKVDVLIIDEISMVRADVFDGVEKMLRLNGKNRGEPFGGVQICVIGDLFQLPPVVSRDEADLFKMFYKSPFFFDAQCFESAQFKLAKFDQIFRQDDLDFIHILNRLRIGDNRSDVLNFLNQRYGQQPVTSGDTTVTLCSTNAIADRLNETKLKELENEAFEYKGEVSADFDVAKNKLPAPEILQLKVGAQVMFTKNDINGKRWVNGTLGIVQNLDKKHIDVLISEGVKPKVVSVPKEKWSTVKYVIDEENETITEEESGSYEQYPLMLAWAVTIHKSQGKTLDHVEINLGRGAFAAGQLYVALSRCRKFDHIYLKNKVNSRDIQCDAQVKSFVKGYAERLKTMNS